MKLYVEKNPFYSNYVAIQQVHEHLPYEVNYFDWTEFDADEAKKHDLVIFQTPEIAASFDADTKAVWHLDDTLNADEAHDNEEERLEKEIEMQRAFSSCVGVVYGTEELRKRYERWYKGNSIVSQAFIDPCEYKHESQPSERITVGFFGTNHYKPEVLEILPVMRRLREEYGVRAVVMGVDMARKEILANGVDHIPHNQDFHAFLRDFVRQGFNIGITWYKSREINLAKTAHKLAQWSWFGIPVVTSECVTGDLARDIALTASNTEELYEQLRKLVRSREYRLGLGMKAKKHCQKVYSLHNNLSLYKEFYENLTNRG